MSSHHTNAEVQADVQTLIAGVEDLRLVEELQSSLTDAALDAMRLDVLEQLDDALESGPLHQSESAVLLRVKLAEYARDHARAAYLLRSIASSPPRKDIVERLLAYEWAEPKIEEPVFLAHFESLSDPKDRACFAAHVAAAYHNVGYEESGATWIDRAVECYPAADRVEVLCSYLSQTELRFATSLIR